MPDPALHGQAGLGYFQLVISGNQRSMSKMNRAEKIVWWGGLVLAMTLGLLIALHKQKKQEEPRPYVVLPQSAIEGVTPVEGASEGVEIKKEEEK